MGRDKVQLVPCTRNCPGFLTGHLKPGSAPRPYTASPCCSRRGAERNPSGIRGGTCSNGQGHSPGSCFHAVSTGAALWVRRGTVTGGWRRVCFVRVEGGWGAGRSCQTQVRIWGRAVGGCCLPRRSLAGKAAVWPCCRGSCVVPAGLKGAVCPYVISP